MSKLNSSTQPHKSEPDAAPSIESKSAAPLEHEYYEVEKTSLVPQGASTFTLPAGKIISTQGYNISALQELGVPLKRVAKPTGNPNPRRAAVIHP